MKGKNISIYLSEERLSKLGENPTQKIRELIDNIGEDKASGDNPAYEIMINSNATEIDRLKEEIEELRNNIDTVSGMITNS